MFFLVACFQTKKSEQESTKDIPTLETGSVQPMPDEWIDKDTGYRIIKLTRNTGGGRSFYFHNNPFIKQVSNEGDLMIYYAQAQDRNQLFSLNLKTLETNQLTSHSNPIKGEIVAPKSRKVYYQSSDSVFATHVDSRQTELIYVFPPDFKSTITTLNADETLLAGSHALELKDEIYKKNPEKKDYFNLIFEARIPHTLFTVDVQTKELKKLYNEKAWLNHVQFSPSDPELLMYCHEGPWHLLNRIWTININTLDTALLHKRTMDMEIAGHEFFSRDGKTIWYDLQQPKGKTFFLAGRNLETGAFTSYAMKRNEWSIHFNISPYQTQFAGDGGDSTQVAHATDGRWIYVFTSKPDSLTSKRLVNMRHHGYRPLEPNVHFSPDGENIIFRSDLDGETHIYAVALN
jgi:oligogalacturonide lyase